MKDELNDLTKRLAAYIKVQRKQRGWSHQTLAEKATLTRRTIGKIEASERNLTVTSLHKIAKAFGSTPEEVIIQAKKMNLTDE
ncbi:MAG: helix-turn-helix transcriptional regulator [Rickettsiales bacterium]|nr:helix-turn-helix transcriptional regulator [Rickettsiales bacterium]